MELNKIHNIDCIEGMKKLDDNSIDCVVTSPPYDNLRDYTNEAKWNFEVFKPIAKELFRVIKDGGVVVWVVGDATIKGSETGTSFKQALYFKECGFKLHDTMIYSKKGFRFPFPNRYHQVFEYMFILVKNKLKTFNGIIDRKNKHSYFTNKAMKREKDGSKTYRKGFQRQEFGKRYNIWNYSIGGKKNFNHPAIFPLQLVKDHIISWSNKGELILDPFIGSGTTAVACKELQRNYIGFEISKEYYNMSEDRLEKWNGQRCLFTTI